MQHIADILKRGGVVIFPTETLYGLVCDATNAEAVRKIYVIKNRPEGKAFPVVVRDWDMLREYGEFDVAQEKKMRKIWTQPSPRLRRARRQSVNIVLRAKNLPENAMINGTTAFRIAKHPKLVELFRFFDRPIVATSANPAGEPPMQDPRLYTEVFGGKAKYIDAVLFNGINRRKIGSRIVSLFQ